MEDFVNEHDGTNSNEDMRHFPTSNSIDQEEFSRQSVQWAGGWNQTNETIFLMKSTSALSKLLQDLPQKKQDRIFEKLNIEEAPKQKDAEAKQSFNFFIYTMTEKMESMQDMD